MTQTRITVGEVARPHGVGGTLKVNPLTDDVRRFEKLKSVIVDGKEYAVLRASVSQSGVFLTLEGVSDRNAAEAFRGKSLQVKRENASVAKGRVLIVDVLGCTVSFEDGEVAGEVVDVLQHGAADVWVLDKGRKQILFPALKRVFVSEDYEAKKIVVSRKAFDEVAVYED